MPIDEINDGRHDFDFLVGRWAVHNTRLRERLCGCTDWDEFEAISSGQMILGGVGNFDATTFDWNGETVHGVTLRLFNPITREWSLNWSDSTTGILFPPLLGRFTDGVGHFYGQELCNGSTIFSRFIWSGISESTARWEQAFSADGGATWETNWIMEFAKRDG